MKTKSLTENLRDRLNSRLQPAPIECPADLVVVALINAVINGNVDVAKFIFDRVECPVVHELKPPNAASIHRDSAVERSRNGGYDPAVPYVPGATTFYADETARFDADSKRARRSKGYAPGGFRLPNDAIDAMDEGRASPLPRQDEQ